MLDVNISDHHLVPNEACQLLFADVSAAVEIQGSDMHFRH